MPENNFSRNQPGDTERKFGEAPILGRVSRTPGSGSEGHGKRRRSMRRKSKKLSVAVVAWTLLISFVVMLMLVVFLVAHFRKKAEEAAEAAAIDESSRRLANAFSDHKTVDLPTISEVGALAIVRAAFANGDVQALNRHFAFSGTAGPEEALAALTEISGNEGEITAYRWVGEKFVNGGVIGQVATQRRNGDELTNRLAQLVIGADGKWRIDLDSYLRKCVPDWPEILSGESKTSLIRIFVAADTYYNGIYSDDAEWQAYVLVSPDADDALYGYARRGSPQDKALRKIIVSGEKIHRAAVEISVDPEAGRRQFEITGVIAEDWVIGGKRFDESF